MKIVGLSKKKLISDQEVMKTVCDLNANKAKPSKAWQQTIQTYCKNNRHCDVRQFTKVNAINKDNGKNKRKKKRAIRLHPYGSAMSDHTSLCMGAEAVKEAANRR